LETLSKSIHYISVVAPRFGSIKGKHTKRLSSYNFIFVFFDILTN